MKKEYYNVEEVSKLLKLHPKTVQRYIREEKIRATKIGKSWRIYYEDLNNFTKINDKNKEENKIIKCSSVLDIKVNNIDDAIRITNSLNAIMNSKPREYDLSTLHTQYIEVENIVRISLWGNIGFMSSIMNLLNSWEDLI